MLEDIISMLALQGLTYNAELKNDIFVDPIIDFDEYQTLNNYDTNHVF